MSYGSAAESIRAVSGMLKVEKRLSPSKAAEFALIDYKNGARWNPATAPYMVEPLDLLASRDVQEIVFVGPSRSSKSFSLVNGGFAYVMTQDPGETAFVQMNQAQARDFIKADIQRTIDASSELAKYKKAGVKNNTVEFMMFNNGMSLRSLWPSRSSLSGKTIRNVFVLDGDNNTGDLSVEEVFSLASKRTQTYLSSAKCVVEGNPGVDFDNANWSRESHAGPPCSGIVSLYNGGDKRIRYWICPHCNDSFPTVGGPELFGIGTLEQQLELIKTADATELADQFCKLPCPKCGSLIDQSQRQAMEQSGFWKREDSNKSNRRASFWLGGICGAYNSWREMLWRYFTALKNYADTLSDAAVKQVLNTEFAMPHVPFAVRIRSRRHDLYARAEEQEKMKVPEGVRFLVATVDVQSNRFEVKVTGFGEHLETWLVDYYSLRRSANGKDPINPAARLEDWGRLKEKAINRRYELADNSGRSMPVVFTAIDSGGAEGVTDKAYKFWLSLDARERVRCRLVKGGAGKEPVKESYVSNDVPLLLLSSNHLKDIVFASIHREEPGADYFHVPSWADESYLKGLANSEVRDGNAWKKVAGARNEPFDLAYYARGAAIYLGADRAQFWQSPPPFALPWDRNPLLSTKPIQQATRSPRVVSTGVSVF